MGNLSFVSKYVSVAIMAKNGEEQSLEVVHPVIQKKLKKLLEDEGLIDYTFNIESGSQKGDNYMGVISKVTIKGKNKVNEDVVHNWIVKSAPNTIRDIMNIVSVYDREIYMYEDIFPYFKKFQLEKHTLAPFNSTAPLVMSHMEHMQETLVMKDMKILGYVMKDRMRPLDYNHVKLVMKAYGKFHAISYALKDQRPEKFAEMIENTQELYFTEMYADEEKAKESSALFNGKALRALDPVIDDRAYKLFEKFMSKHYPVMLRALKSSNAYSVIGHGDSWVNNMLFKYDNPDYPDNPTEVCLLDFQLAKYGSPAFDLSYFIFTCTDHETRAKHYDEMIKLYYYSLCVHLLDLGSDPDKLISFEALQDELKNFSFFGLMLSIMVIYLMLSDKDEIPEINDQMNMDELAEAYNFESKNINIYNERIRGVILDFVSYGYLDIFE